VPVAIKAGGVMSNFTSIAISPLGGICSDLHGPGRRLQRIAMATASSSPGSNAARELHDRLANMVVAQGKVDVAFGDFFAGRRHGGQSAG